MPLTHPAFPNSVDEPFQATSPKDFKYNCIGWAYGTTKNMWPNSTTYYWPPDIQNTSHIDSFIQLFESRGYALCDNGDLEAGFLKVAIYVDAQGTPTHAARQLPSGDWTSKLGNLQDVSHSISSMANGGYGNVARYMRKAI